MLDKIQIAVRTFSVPDSPASTVTVTLFLPVAEPDGRSFVCDFIICGTGVDTVEFHGVGVDGFEAILNTLAMIDAHIDIINKEDFGGKLRWHKVDASDLCFRSHWSK